MGMFDRVWAKCQCGTNVEFQTKAGECSLHDYSIDNAPDKIKADIIGEAESCSNCGKILTIAGTVLLRIDCY